MEKVLTSAALIDSGTATPRHPGDRPAAAALGRRLDQGPFEHERRCSYNMRGVIANSSNIGIALLTRQMAKQKLHDYLAASASARRPGSSCRASPSGIMPRADMTDGQRDQVAFGQAISVTAIQEAAAIAGIVNDGVYNPPTVIKRATDAGGQRGPSWATGSRAGSISAEELGQGPGPDAGRDRQPERSAQPQAGDYQTGGKTGTAQRADTNCHCYKGYVTSFVGFAPLDDPQILTYVVIIESASRATPARRPPRRSISRS